MSTRKKKPSVFDPPRTQRFGLSREIPQHIRDAAMARARGEITAEESASIMASRVPNAAAAKRGRVATQRGAKFEAILERMHTTYELRGIARMRHLHPEVGALPRTGDGPPALYYKGPADFDYIGPWCPNPNAHPAQRDLYEVVFDAKSITDMGAHVRLPTTLKQRVTWERQITQLEAHAKMHPRIVAFFLLWNADHHCAWIADLPVLRRIVQGERVPVFYKKRGETLLRHALPVIEVTPAAALAGTAEVDYLASLARMLGLPSP